MDNKLYASEAQCCCHSTINRQKEDVDYIYVNYNNNIFPRYYSNSTWDNYGHETFQIQPRPSFQDIRNVNVNNLHCPCQLQIESNILERLTQSEINNYCYLSMPIHSHLPIMTENQNNLTHHKAFEKILHSYKEQDIKIPELRQNIQVKDIKEKTLMKRNQILSKKRSTKFFKNNKTFHNNLSNKTIKDIDFNKFMSFTRPFEHNQGPLIPSDNSHSSNNCSINARLKKDIEDINKEIYKTKDDETHKKYQYHSQYYNTSENKRLLWYEEPDISENLNITTNIKKTRFDNESIKDTEHGNDYSMMDSRNTMDRNNITMEETKDFDVKETIPRTITCNNMYRCIPKIFLPMERFSSSEDSDNSDIDVINLTCHEQQRNDISKAIYHLK